MAPAANYKGAGKKNGGTARYRTRIATAAALPPPVPKLNLPPIEPVDTEYLELRVERFRNLTYDDLVDAGAVAPQIPNSRSLDAMIARLNRLQGTIDRRSTFFDRGMRTLAASRKNRVANVNIPRPKTDPKGQKPKLKKRKASDQPRQDSTAGQSATPQVQEGSRPRKVARETGKGKAGESSVSPIMAPPPRPSAVNVTAPPSAKGKKEEDESEDEDEDEEGEAEAAQQPPRKEVPKSLVFGNDPSTFPDPTVYEIRPVVAGMPEAEIRAIYSVGSYPKNNLLDLVAGKPPDKDFSNAKPASQISYSTFASYMEPHFRPFSEEDLAFLRERGDRVAPFLIPKRAQQHYTDIWAEEDCVSADEPPPTRDRLPLNQARGAIDDMTDDVAETDKLAVGPLLTRLLQILRPETRPLSDEARQTADGTGRNEGVNPSGVGDGNNNVADLAEDRTLNGRSSTHTLPPAAFMADSLTETWKKASHPRLEYGQVDERLKQELRHMGFLPLDGGVEEDYDGHFDDQIAQRLRLLQGWLRERVLVNGTRKARLMGLVRERMAAQEYQNILEDLDSQVQTAYLKRTRTMGKAKKTKRPGGAGGGSHPVGGGAGAGGTGVARHGIGDMTRTLMERRRRWIDTIGSVFEGENLYKVPRSSDPGSSIFAPSDMAALIKREKEQWDEEDVEDEPVA